MAVPVESGPDACLESAVRAGAAMRPEAPICSASRWAGEGRLMLISVHSTAAMCGSSATRSLPDRSEASAAVESDPAVGNRMRRCRPTQCAGTESWRLKTPMSRTLTGYDCAPVHLGDLRLA